MVPIFTLLISSFESVRSLKIPLTTVLTTFEVSGSGLGLTLTLWGLPILLTNLYRLLHILSWCLPLCILIQKLPGLFYLFTHNLLKQAGAAFGLGSKIKAVIFAVTFLLNLKCVLCVLFVCLGWWCWRAGLQTTLQLTVTFTSWLAMKTATELHTQAPEHKHTQPPANVERRNGLLGYTPRPPIPTVHHPPYC